MLHEVFDYGTLLFVLAGVDALERLPQPADFFAQGSGFVFDDSEHDSNKGVDD